MILPKFIQSGTFVMFLALVFFLIQSPDWAYITIGMAQIGFLAWCVFKINQSKNGIAFNVISASAFAILTYLIISPIWSEIAGISIFAVPLYALFPIVILTRAMNGGDLIEGQIFYRGLSIIGIGLAAYALYQYATDSGMNAGLSNYPFYNPNSLAVMLGICGLSNLYFLTKGETHNRWIYGVGMVLICMAMATTQSRAGIFMFGGVSLFLLGMQYYAKEIKAHFGLILFIAIIGLMTGTSYVMHTPIIGDGGVGAMTSMRMIIWTSTMQAIMNTSPIIGNGAGTFTEIYAAYQNPLDNTFGHHAHNDVLHVWLELGLIGVVLLMGLVIGIVIVIIRATMEPDVHKDKIIAIAIILFMGGMAMATPIILLPIFLMILAIGIADLMPLINGKAVSWAWPKQYITVMIVFVIVTITSGLAQTWYHKAIEYSLDKGDMTHILDDVTVMDTLSMGLNPAVPILRASMLNGLIEDGLIEKEQMDDAYSEVIHYTNRAKHIHPYNAQAYYIEGKTLLAQGKREEARNNFDRGLQINPKDFEIRLALANLTSDIDKKLTILREGIGYKYIHQNPTGFYRQTMILARLYNDTELSMVASQALQAEMRLKSQYESNNFINTKHPKGF